jgi:hypothetical protein
MESLKIQNKFSITRCILAVILELTVLEAPSTPPQPIYTVQIALNYLYQIIKSSEKLSIFIFKKLSNHEFTKI